MVAPTVEALVELSRSGRHAASDHLETAALAGVETVGCRRCGGGLAGAVYTSNVAAGARVAAELGRELVIFDGSGAAFPPIETDACIVVVGGHQDPAVAAGYLNEYRLLVADLVILTMAESGTDWERVRNAVLRVVRPGIEVVSTVLRPHPAADVRGQSVAFFSTAPPAMHAVLASHLAQEYGADVVHVSGNLADRAALTEELRGIEADVFLVELKAAAIDVVAEHALASGIRVVLAANDLVGDFDEQLLALAPVALR